MEKWSITIHLPVTVFLGIEFSWKTKIVVKMFWNLNIIDYLT